MADPVSDLSSETLKIVPRRHPLRFACALVLLALLAGFLLQMVTNERYNWPIVWAYFFSPQILAGLWRTLELTVIAMGAGIVIGVVLAMMGLSRNPVLAATSALYVWFFRGTPLLVQIIFWFNIAALYPDLFIGLPALGIGTAVDINAIITPWLAAVLALSLHEGAYMAEIVRGGIISIDKGQSEAATALGMTRRKSLRHIILPQAMRIIIPPTGNQVISMLKTTSLVSVLALPELLYSAQIIYSRNFQVMPLLIVASLWYLIVTTVLSLIQRQIERKLK